MAAQLTRRTFLHVAGVASAAAVLAACAPKGGGAPAQPTTAPAATSAPAATAVPPTPEPAPAQAIELQWWTGWTGQFIKAWEQLSQTPEWKEIVGPNTLQVKTNGGEPLLAAVAAGSPPDLGGNGFFYLDFMARGVLFPIGELVAKSTIIKKEDFIPSSWDSGFYKGVQYGVPANEGFVRYALVYNGRMVEAAGLDPKKPPVTWTEMLEWHKALTKFDNAGNLKQIGLDPYDCIGGSMNPIDGFFAGDSWGFKFWDATTGEFSLDNDKMAEIFDTYAEYYRIIGPDKMAGFRSVEGQGNWGGSYFSEVQAMVVDGYWHCGWTQDAKPDVAKNSYYTWAPVTDARRGAKMQYVGGHVLCLFKDSPNHEAAFKVTEFVQTKLACDTLYNMYGFLPSRPGYIKTADPSRYPGLDFFFKSLDEATEWEKLIPCVIAQFAETQYLQLGESVYRDQMTSKQAAAEMQRRCTEEWKKAGL